MLISPEIQSSSTFILSFQSIKPKTRCFIQMSDIDNHKYLVNISQTILVPALVPRFQLTQVQHLHSVSNSFEALSVFLGLLSAVHLYVSFLASKTSFQYASMWSIETGWLYCPRPSSSCPIYGWMETRPSALGKSDPFCGPSNPWHLFTKDYTIFCRPSNPQYLFPKNYAIFFWQIIDINKKFCTVSINFLLQLFKLFSFLG